MRIMAMLAAGVAAILPENSSFAADIYQVAVGETVKIDRHNVCKEVTNNGSYPIMVPTRDASEWVDGKSAFLENLRDMPGVTVEECGPWWEGGKTVLSPSDGAFEVSYTFQDGTSDVVFRYTTPLDHQLPHTYDHDTGACSPRKSFKKMYSPWRTEGDELFYILLIFESDGIATNFNPPS